MPKKSKGRIMLAIDTKILWELPLQLLGFVAHLHRAIMLHGNRDRGLLGRAEVESIAGDKQVFEYELQQLTELGVLVDEGDGTLRVTTWPAAADAARRKTLQKSAKHRRLCADNAAETQAQTSEQQAQQALLGTSSLLSSSSLLDQDPSHKHLKRDPITAALRPGIAQVYTEWAAVEPMSRIKKLDVFIDKLLNAYPRIDLLAEGRKIALWWEANPSKRKTDRGLKRFVSAWVARATPAATEQQSSKLGPRASSADATWSKQLGDS